MKSRQSTGKRSNAYVNLPREPRRTIHGEDSEADESPVAGRVEMQVKLNTDESPSVATEYGIRSIPTVMIFKDGQKLDTVIGAVPKSTLTGTIDKFLD